jgi:TonB family protein
VTNSRLKFLKDKSNKIPSWFVEAQRAEYLYLAAHLKFSQYFLFHEKSLNGFAPSLNIKLNNPKATQSGYYYLFLSDYFLLPFFDIKDDTKGPSLMIKLYNKASDNIHSKLKDEVLTSFQKYTLVTLYNACRSEEDIEVVDEFAGSKKFNFSQSERSLIAFQKSEVTENLKNIKERSSNVRSEKLEFYAFPSKSLESNSSSQNIAIDENIYARAELNPEFTGGIDGLKRFIKEKLVYPTQCKEAGIQGRVLIMMVVEKDGSITNPRIIKSVNTLLDEEALRIANLLPNFKPGMNKGMPVRVEIVLPMDFDLNN